MKIFNFDNQKPEISEPDYCLAFALDGEAHDFTDNEIAIGEVGSYTETLYVKTFNDNSNYSTLLTGVEGGFYLHQGTTDDNSQSVKLTSYGLVLSLGRTLVCLSWPELKLNWKLRPDGWAIFEFYDLEDDLLLRGELCIYRINLCGEIIWSFGGLDIWVNIDGKPEVTVLDNFIRLIDFEANEYLIDYNGKLLEGPTPNRARTYIKPRRPWWQFWKR